MNGHLWQFGVSGVTEQGVTQIAYCVACYRTCTVFIPHGQQLLWNLPWFCPGQPTLRVTSPGKNDVRA